MLLQFSEDSVTVFRDISTHTGEMDFKIDVSFQDETDISMNISVIDYESDENNNISKEKVTETTTDNMSLDNIVTSTPKCNRSNVYKCSHCDFESKYRANIYRHKSSVHGKRKFSCDTCGKQCGYLYSLKEHIRSAHQKESYMCEYCSDSFPSHKQLNDHRKKSHRNNENSNKFKCTICCKVMWKKLHYEGHMNKHNDTMNFECRICSKKFFYKYSLNRHQLRCSGNIIEKFKCDICTKIFTTRVALKYHQQGKHVRQDLVCKCGKTYKWRTALARHRRKCEIDKLF